MATVEIVNTTPEHVDYMQENARAADKAEFWAAGFETPRSAANASLRFGKTFTGLCDGVPVCIFGVIPQSMVGNTATIWLISSEKINDCPITFLRMGKKRLLELSAHYGMLYNYVDARYAESVKWLKWLGFTIHEPEPCGPLGVLFHKFTLGGVKRWDGQPPQ